MDEVTGDLLFFGYEIANAPYIHVGTADKNGNVVSAFPVTIESPVMMHDFSITGNRFLKNRKSYFFPNNWSSFFISKFRIFYLFPNLENFMIIMDLPLIFEKTLMFTNPSKMPFFFNSSRASRFGLIPRNSTDESSTRWFTAKACFVFHVLNSWEEGDEVLLYATR